MCGSLLHLQPWQGGVLQSTLLQNTSITSDVNTHYGLVSSSLTVWDGLSHQNNT
jgi:hypothetical protein